MICLTYDTDHMSEIAMKEFLGRFPVPGRGTFFCHRAFAALAATDHELAPHPFIGSMTDWQPGLAALEAGLARKPKGVRPHSCVYSHEIGVALHRLGYAYISQANSMYQPGLKPFRHPWGVWELPIYYMDNMDFWMTKNWPALKHEPFSRRVIEVALADDEALFVFDLHPLHIALNTRSPEDYVSVKERILDEGTSPFDLTFGGRGVRVFYEELREAMERRNVRSHSCAQALQHFGCLSC